MKYSHIMTFIVALILVGCNDPDKLTRNTDLTTDRDGHSPATLATIKANRQVLESRPFHNQVDFEEANRGLIASDPNLIVLGKDKLPIWDMPSYDFVKYQGKDGSAPSSVNPSLWRQAALNNIHGLFKVVDGVYQIRGYDLANMSIIESDNGWILIDPLTSKETASQALKFAQQHLGKKPIVAIIFTHSHIDHFGGIQGILDNLTEPEKHSLRIIAPQGFTEEATSENIIAGTAMSRRAMYMYGKQLSHSNRGHIGTGLGKGPAFGTFGLVEPTELVNKTGESLLIDGITFEFQFVPDSEAPAEFTFYLPQYKAFCGAEMLSRTMHNVYTLRGAKVRDAKRWSAYIEEARLMFNQAEVYFGSHHWPLWGKRKIQQFMLIQRDTYKYIHDQSVRLINKGYTPNEIAEEIKLPPSLQQEFYNQGYYGTLSHNSKAVYQHYIGWFSGNPANLNPLPESESAKRTISMMGGVDKVLIEANKVFAEADKLSVVQSKKSYRWLAELLNKAVFSQPEHDGAKQLLAKVYDQLGYQSESAPWRDVYLSGAYELRHGTPDKGIDIAIMKEVFLQTPVEYFFDSMSVRLNGEEAIDENHKIKISFTDLNKSYLLSIENAVLHHKEVSSDLPADATLQLTHPLFIEILIGQAGLGDTLFSDDLRIEGSRLDLIRFFSLLEKPAGTFNIVTP